MDLYIIVPGKFYLMFPQNESSQRDLQHTKSKKYSAFRAGISGRQGQGLSSGNTRIQHNAILKALTNQDMYAIAANFGFNQSSVFNCIQMTSYVPELTGVACFSLHVLLVTLKKASETL